MSQSMAPTRRSCRSKAPGGVFVAPLALISATGIAAEPAAPSNDAITVQGNRRIDADTVRSHFHAAPDGRFDAAALDAALTALLGAGLFDHVAIDRAGERLLVHLTEAPVLDRVAFEGNKKIKDAELAAVVESKARGTL